MGFNSGVYNVFLFLHVLAVIVGFGGVLLNGIYASRARRYDPSQALAVLEVNGFVSTKVAEWFIIAAGVLGFGLVSLSDDVFSWGQTWVWLSILLYVVSLGVSHGLLLPRVRTMIATQAELASGSAPSETTARVAALGKQVGAFSGILHLSFVVILALMIFKPGSGL